MYEREGVRFRETDLIDLLHKIVQRQHPDSIVEVDNKVASIPATMRYVGLRADRRHHRHDRQWVVAEVVASAQLLIDDIDPMRRVMNLNPAQGAEDQRWTDLERRRDEVRGRLAVIATGHASREVRDLARRLATELYNAAISTRWAVHDMLFHRDNPEQMATAKQDHQTASATAAELQHAVQVAGSGQPRRKLSMG